MNDKGPVESGSEILKNVTEGLVNITKIMDYFRKRFGIGPAIIEAYKKILNDYINSDQHTTEEKLYFAATFKQKIKELQNMQDVLDGAAKEFKEDADPSQVDPDWYAFFFDLIKNVSQKSVQLVLSKILASEINNPDTISKSLVQTIILIGKKQLDTFCDVSCFCWNEYKTDLTHLFIFISDEPKAYADCKITWQRLKDLERLGLIVCDSTIGFALEGNRTFRKGQLLVDVTADKNGRIPTGNVVFTDDGKVLYDLLDWKITKRYRADIFDFLVNELKKKGCGTWARRG